MDEQSIEPARAQSAPEDPIADVPRSEHPYQPWQPVTPQNPWPQGPVLWYGPSVDITKAVVDAYNVQSGVPAPAAGSAPAAPSASRPAGTAPARKPATTTTAPPK